jgi:hypothetical protein
MGFLPSTAIGPTRSHCTLLSKTARELDGRSLDLGLDRNLDPSDPLDPDGLGWSDCRQRILELHAWGTVFEILCLTPHIRADVGGLLG